MIIVKLIATFFVAYLAICLYLYFFQEKQIFFPPPSSNVFERIPAENKISLNINGIELEGIYSGKINNYKPVIIYFGGNAENVFYNLPDFTRDLNAQFVAINYRGFAGNEGKPTINALLQDAEAILAKLIIDFSLNPSNIFLMGRSLGGAIVMQLSEEKEYAGIILISPFDSMTNLAKHYFPWLPVSLLLKHPLDSLTIAKHSRTPSLILVAENDQIIPVTYSQALFDAWSTMDKKIKIIENTGHNTIHNGQNYFRAINSFLKTKATESP